MLYAFMVWGTIYFTLFPNTKLPYTLWGPVSITKFPPPYSMYKPALCFDGFKLFPYTNLPYTSQ